MKNLFLIPVVALLMSSCNHDEVNQVNSKNDSLTSIVDVRDAELNDFISSFNEIETNLDSVAARQQIISVTTDKYHGEIMGNKKARINGEIHAINNLMEKNRKEIEDLKTKWKGSKYQNALLEKTLKTLTTQLSQKDYELCELNLSLDALKNKVEKLNTTIDSLDDQNYIKKIVIDFQTSDLHTAYYVVGESKVLKDEKVIDKKGGVLGMGKTATLNENFDERRFTRINTTQVTTIPVDGDDIKIVTNHPTDSYKLDKDASKKDHTNNLIISDPDKFWSASKYLVIVKK